MTDTVPGGGHYHDFLCASHDANARRTLWVVLLTAVLTVSYTHLAARALIVEGVTQPSGYTEPLLHKYRLAKKAAA